MGPYLKWIDVGAYEKRLGPQPLFIGPGPTFRTHKGIYNMGPNL
jgi:hypothetical protein